MMASDAGSSPSSIGSVSIRVDLDHTCGSIFEAINAVLSAFGATKRLSTTVGQWSTMVGLQQLYFEFVYRIYIRLFIRYSIHRDLEYSF